MTSKQLLTALILSLGLTLLLGWALGSEPLPVARAAGPWYVAPGGNDGNDCLFPGTACATINGALAKAGFLAGDTVFVAIGTYTGTGGEVVLLDKDATLSGGWDGTFTTQSGTSTIDGEDARRGIYVNSGVTAVVSRINVQNGYTGDGNGGGVYNSGILTITNSTISDNFAYYSGYGGHGGGGIYNIGTLTLINCTVKNNTATDSGGGIYGFSGSSTVIVDTQIYANMTDNCQGGGIELDYDSHLIMSRSWVVGNAALGNDAGGIGFDYGGSAYIENSIVAGNTADRTGGGLWFMQGGPYHIINSNIVGNLANETGAAISGYGGVQIEITNTLIISNTGDTGIDDQWDSGAVFLLFYCDTYGNSPDGNSTATINRTNCLGTPPEDGLDPLMSGGALPDGVGPAFADEWMSYDYSLQAGSPAIDTGDDTACPSTDLGGVTRPQGAACDIGAYEFVPVANQPPTADPNGPYEADEGDEVEFDGTGSFDPDGDDLDYSWNFGDGTTGSEPVVTHIYADNGDYIVTLTVTDPAGLDDSQTTTATIANVAPTVEAGPDQTAYAGDTVNLAPATFSDPGVLDTHTATIDWGDGSPVEAGVVTESDGSGTVSGAHVYSDGGTFTVEVCVTDQDGGVGCDTFGVTVEPAVTIVNIDIKPGSDSNPINCNNRKGVIPVAILTTAEFDATTVNHTTVTFAGASETHVNKKSGEPRRHEQDVDEDGDADLVFHFRLGDTSLTCESTEGTLTGETFGGQVIEGTDAVRMIN